MSLFEIKQATLFPCHERNSPLLSVCCASCVRQVQQIFHGWWITSSSWRPRMSPLSARRRSSVAFSIKQSPSKPFSSSLWVGSYPGACSIQFSCVSTARVLICHRLFSSLGNTWRPRSDVWFLPGGSPQGQRDRDPVLPKYLFEHFPVAQTTKGMRAHPQHVDKSFLWSLPKPKPRKK